MQFYALEGKTPILATRAERGRFYVCPECRSPLRVRGGPSRQLHFYHTHLSEECRQSIKSEEHLALQFLLYQRIGEKRAHMEFPLSSIGRIADVIWEERNLVFEIQCSSLSLEEAKQRNEDYNRAGFQVVWIMHDKRFNKRTLSAAEFYLRSTGCYFTNVDRRGEGVIYDQFEIIRSYKRLFRGPKLFVNPLYIEPAPKVETSDLRLPQIALLRIKEWNYLTRGDLLFRLIREGALDKEASLLVDKEKFYLEGRKKREKMPLFPLLAKLYRTLLHTVLKKT